MRGMTIRTRDVVSPMLAATEVVVFFLTCVALKANLRSLFCSFVFEGSDLGLVTAAVYVFFSRPVARFAALTLALPVCLDET